jgi:hypothetical protein
LLAFAALALRVLAMRPRRLLVAAATLALASSTAALSCHHNPDRTLTPDEHTRFHVADRLGSAALVLDHRGRVLTRDAADPYGASRLAWRADDDTAAPTYRFTGKEDDALSGAIAIGARHYLPSSAAGRAPTRTSCSRTPTPPWPRPARPTPTATSAATPSASPTRPAARASRTAARTAPASSTTSPTARIRGFEDRMAAVAHDRALAEHRSAQLASMAYGVLDAR